MGLCKCPKRQVTNQFCFDHRVNVCENCMVTSHPKCIVQSYLQWLKDSDYDPNCTLCRNPLDAKDCVRLTCYHVFHWECINGREAFQPANTALSGRVCPTCQEHIFPPANLISPVADVLRNKLGQVNWGRNELGLPLLSEEMIETKKPMHTSTQIFQSSTSGSSGSSSSSSSSSSSQTIVNKNRSNGNPFNNANATTTKTAHSAVLNIDYSPDLQASSRKPLLPRQSPIGASDRDDDKYKRRTPSEIFSRWSRRFYAPSSRPPWRRTWFIILCGILLFVFLIYAMSKLGRRATEYDQSLGIDNNEFLHANDN